MSNKLGSEPAFACTSTDTQKYDAYLQEGMSKRFYAACAAMQGILSAVCPNESIVDFTDRKKEYIVAASYRLADELLKQENL